MNTHLSQSSNLSIHNIKSSFLKDFTKIEDDKNDGSEKAFSVASELLAFLRALEMSKALRRSLIDTARTELDRVTLVSQILKSVKSQQLTIKIVCALVKLRWSDEDSLREAIREFLFMAAISSVKARGDEKTVQKDLEAIESHLFQFRETLIDKSTNSQELIRLREILSHERFSVSGRLMIIDQLLGSLSSAKKVDKITVLLAKCATMSLRGKRFVVSLGEISNKIADIRGKVVVRVTAAQKLNKEQVKRLEQILEKKHNKSVQINIIIDKNVLGGIKIEEGASVFDATLLNSFNEMKRKFEYSL